MINPEATQRNPARYTDVLGGLVLFIASLVIVGWIFGVGFLKSVLPGAVVMQFNTALGLFFAGIALRGVARSRRLLWRMIERVCATFIICLGALTLAEYIFGWEAGIDNLVFRGSAGAVGTIHAGRMSPHTAASFLLCGFAFLSSTSPRAWQRIFSQVLVSCVAFIALAVLAGHLYGALYFMASRSSSGWRCIPRSRFWRSAPGSFARSARVEGEPSFSVIRPVA